MRHLQEKYKTNKQRPVTCIYLNDQEKPNQTPKLLYGSLLKQLLQLDSSRPIPEELRIKYEELNERAQKLGGPELKALFEQQLKVYDRVYLVVDALNEASEEARRMVEYQLCTLSQKQNLSLLITTTAPGIKRESYIFCDVDDCQTPAKKEGLNLYFQCGKCMSTRNKGNFDICKACRQIGKHCLDASHALYEPYERVEIEVYASQKEIEAYIEYRVNDETPEQVNEILRDTRKYPKTPGKTLLARKLDAAPELKERIYTEIPRKSDGKFLLAKLYMDSLVTKLTVKELRFTLDTFPDNWEHLYHQKMKEEILTQEPKDKRDLALNVLALNTCAVRALTFVELEHALATKAGDKSFDEEKKVDSEEIFAVTKGLLTINDGTKENSFVRFFHQTLQAYLYTEKDTWFTDAESKMATACLTCLEYDVFSKREVQSEAENARRIEKKIKDNPFAGYALEFWGMHVNASSDPVMENQALRFLQDSDRVAAVAQTIWYAPNIGSDGLGASQDSTALHLCAWFGLSSLILRLGLENRLDDEDVNASEKATGQTPLMYACRRGHVEAAQKLLELGARINEPDNTGETALFAAIRAGQKDVIGDVNDGTKEVEKGIVTFLLEDAGLDINWTNNKRQTALTVAIHLGYEEVAEAISKCPDLDPNIQDLQHLAALPLAAGKGYLGTVNALLAKPGIELNQHYSSRKYTVLIAVASSGKKNQCEIIRALLEHGADPNLRDNLDGRTALTAAVEKGDINIVTTFLEFEQANRFCTSNSGRGLIHYAAQFGHCDIVRLLKEKGLDVNMKDNNGLTPLHDAALFSQSDAVKALLELGADPGAVDNLDRRPVKLAAQNEDTDIVAILKTDQIDEEIAIEEACPVWLLASRGRIDLIAAALEQGKSNLDEKDPDTGNGPLHIAALKGYDEILRLLLDKGDMNVNSRGRDGFTPLHFAAFHGHIGSFDILLEHKAELDLVDDRGRPPLFYAQQTKHIDLALSLVVAGAAVDPVVVGRTKLFFAAVESNNVQATKMLLEKGANPTLRNREGLSARQIAKRGGMGEMVKVLDGRNVAVDENVPLVGLGIMDGNAESRILELPSPPQGFLPLREKKEEVVERVAEVQQTP